METLHHFPCLLVELDHFIHDVYDKHNRQALDDKLYEIKEADFKHAALTASIEILVEASFTMLAEMTSIPLGAFITSQANLLSSHLVTLDVCI